MKTELAYSYRTVCAILDAKGWSEEQIAAFLKKHQNATGYIKSSLLPA